MKALEINVNKDRAAHCVLQLECSFAPDGAVIQLVDIPYYSQSQGITRAEFCLSGIPLWKKAFTYMETITYTISHPNVYQIPSSGHSEVKLLLLQHKAKPRMGTSLSAWTVNSAVYFMLIVSF